MATCYYLYDFRNVLSWFYINQTTKLKKPICWYSNISYLGQCFSDSLRLVKHWRLNNCTKKLSERWTQYVFSPFSVLSQFFHSSFSVLSQFFLSSFSVLSQFFLSSFSVLSQFFLSSFSVLSQFFLNSAKSSTVTIRSLVQQQLSHPKILKKKLSWTKFTFFYSFPPDKFKSGITFFKVKILERGLLSFSLGLFWTLLFLVNI